MRRRFPSGDEDDDDPLIHSAISFFLIVAGMAAAIAMISGLCGYRKKPATRNPSSPEDPGTALTATAETSMVPPPPPPPATTREESEDARENQDPLIKELPLPPALKTLRETYSCNNFVTKSASTRQLDSSFSVKIPRVMSVRKNQEPEKQQRKKGKLKAENSILIRPIILGEKCRVPADEDDAVLYDGKGKKITTYHPKSSSSFCLSRSRSKIDENALPSPDKEKEVTTRKDDKEIL